ncbi:unnamed protein product [Arabis nemorensis]|uniref:Uncharacterized protein n=1 Tax=Arabis nemorensis TaxID=586526 RepID=A0A565CTI3_9BRAS|nr:unnamed protein product [Arabis nemorensis]
MNCKDLKVWLLSFCFISESIISQFIKSILLLPPPLIPFLRKTLAPSLSHFPPNSTIKGEIKLHRLVECEGCSVSEPDGLGYYALQWSALNNRTAVAHYIVEVWFFCALARRDSDFTFLLVVALEAMFTSPFSEIDSGGDINATDHTGQTALHWSAVRGVIQVAELLLKCRCNRYL